MKNKKTFPIVDFIVVPTVTFIFDEPKPKTKLLMVTDVCAGMSMIPDFDIPKKMRSPSRLMDQGTYIASPDPMFFITALTPKPPAIE